MSLATYSIMRQASLQARRSDCVRAPWIESPITAGNLGGGTPGALRNFAEGPPPGVPALRWRRGPPLARDPVSERERHLSFRAEAARKRIIPPAKFPTSSHLSGAVRDAPGLPRDVDSHLSSDSQTHFTPFAADTGNLRKSPLKRLRFGTSPNGML